MSEKRRATLNCSNEERRQGGDLDSLRGRLVRLAAVATLAATLPLSAANARAAQLDQQASTPANVDPAGLSSTWTALGTVVVAPGDDGWATAPGDATADFANPCPNIPAGFFGPGSPAVGPTIVFGGEPLATAPAGALGETDTIVRRLASTVALDVGDSDTVPIEIVALHLRSTAPVLVPGFGSWDVEACLSATTAQTTSSMTITRVCDDGGTYSGTVNVTARLIFTRVGAGTIVVMDPAPLKAFATACNWVIPFGPGGFDPDAFGLQALPPGIGIDGDCDGTFDGLTIGDSPTFRAGIVACGAGAFSLAICVESEPCSIHRVGPPTTAVTGKKNAIDFVHGSGVCGTNQNQTIGWAFDVLTPITVTRMTWFDDLQDGLDVQHEVGIWDPGGNLISSTNVIIPAGAAAPLDGIWRTVDIQPTPLPAGTGYIVGGYNGPHNECLNLNVTQVVHPDINYVDATFSVLGAVLERPANFSAAVNGFYGVGFQIDTGGGGATPYCDPGGANSVSAGGAVLTDTGGYGTASATFLLTDVPNQPGLLYAGPNQVNIPFGCGDRCVGGQVIRGSVLVPTGNQINTSFDMSPPNALSIQYWYRDPANLAVCGASYNLSNALMP